MKWLLILTFTLNCFAQEMREVDIPVDSPREFVAQINENCTATFISPTTLVTAHHCIDHINNNVLPSRDEIVYRARTDHDMFENIYAITHATKLSGNSDLALITVVPPLNTGDRNFPQIKCIDLENIDYSSGQKKVVLTGYPGSTGSKLREANCNSWHNPRDFKSFLRYDFQTEGGVSGSSIRYANDSMSIIGIHTGELVEKYGTLFQPHECEEIRQFIYNESIESFSNGYNVPDTYLKGLTCPIGQ